jgi:hypothetical protein
MRLIPIFNAEHRQHFVESRRPWTVLEQGQVISTNYLKTGKEVNLLGVSSSEELIQAGLINLTDAIDPAVSLDLILLSYQGRSVYYDCRDLPLAAFPYSPHGNYREVEVNFTTVLDHAFKIPNNTLKVSVRGKVNLELGTCKIDAEAISSLGYDGFEVLGYTLKAARVKKTA